MTYQFMWDMNENKSVNNAIRRLQDGASIPFSVDNTDYQQFKIDVVSGAELQDPDGNVMTQQEVNDFLKTIP